MVGGRSSRFKDFSLTIFFFFFFLCFCVTYIISHKPQILSECLCFLSNIEAENISFKNLKSEINYVGRVINNTKSKIGARRLLDGPGSTPPRCASKCGGCTPCTPIHVPVPLGTTVATEYYLEAWRCKCSNKFYVP